MVVMDIIYNPLKTRLLAEAQNRGCTIIDGLSMFMHQGAVQFELWTGITPEINIAQEAILYSARPKITNLTNYGVGKNSVS